MTKNIKFWFSLCTGILCVFFIVSSCSDKDEILPDDDTPGMVKDIEGNKYRTVKIGDQIWMAENLRTTKYNDGVSIPYHVSNSDWMGTTDGAFAWYDNDEEQYKSIYGGLYNFYSVETGKLCPVGWRVPDDEDWYQLRNFLYIYHYQENAVFGGPYSYGNVLKSCRQIDSPMGGECNTAEIPFWYNHDINYGSDLYGFSAIPGGSRGDFGKYINMGINSIYWSSVKETRGIYWYLSYKRGDISREMGYDYRGYSVRCIRN